MTDKRQKTWRVNLSRMILIIGVFTLVSLMLLSVGFSAYKNIVVGNNDNFQLRTSLAYVATKIRQTDTVDILRMNEKDGISVLILGEEIGGLAMKL